MSVHFTRRQMLRLALVGSATLASTSAVIGPQALTTFAGSPSSIPSTVVLGLRAGVMPAGGAVTAVPLLAQSLEIESGLQATSQIPQLLEDGISPILEVHESITGCASLADGSFVALITPTPDGVRASQPTRLTHVYQDHATSVPITGLKSDEQIGSVAATGGTSLVGLLEKRNGTPPVRLVGIDVQTGAISDNQQLHLPGLKRFTTLGLCPNGRMYSSIVGRDGVTSLVDLDAGTTVPLTEDGVAWNNGLSSLVCSHSNQLLALTAPRYTLNGVYSVDPLSGALRRLYEFEVAKLTIS